ncbi:NAD(P)/FAD-dependent oxidoreductase [Bacillus sp. REN10]|uniref:NAD(P)/FAD-dependent oxidoreductase n=1 Tax=Bacillus sp. REN10 TaxID=2782541 RepID=UPI00193B4EAF|nr:NAD(P)/FAD-dependent oxidoreductase [Bacillus sp. REN10]
MKHLVLLGGGYGNMRVLLRLLPNNLPEDVTITLVDKVPYHCLKTEYYALAAGTISDHEVRVAFPEHSRLNIVFGAVKEIDLENKRVLLEEEESISYDDLVIGLGCEDKYHNVPGAEQYTHSIQSIEKARHTYQTLSNMPARSKVGIIGAGLSGIEIASELRESRPDLEITLFDRGPRILKDFPERLSKYIHKWFVDHGVTVVNNANIVKVEPKAIYNNEDVHEMDAVVWTAGIQPNIVVRKMNVEKDSSGRIKLSPYHNLPNDEHVYVVGDCASLPHAPSAQLAEEQAEQIVQVLQKRWKNEPLPEKLPEMKLKGVLGSLGKKQGFGFVADRAITGRVARFLKSGVLWLYKYHNG